MSSSMDIEQALRLLVSHPDYRVVSRIPANRTQFSEPDGRPLLKGVIVDTETTGTNQDSDAIIELGMITFEYDPDTGEVFRILEVFDQLEDPGFPIPAESTEVHGITDDMVSGKHLDDVLIAKILDGASIVIAHNSKFDRVFLEKRLPIFEAFPWGCSYAQVDWDGEGFGSAKLEYIAYKFGFFYEAHRAEEDCFALLEILQQKLPKTGAIVLRSILTSLPEKSYTISALKSPFETKDILKTRGYRWDADKKCWHITVNGDDPIKSEVAWLKSNVYGSRPASVEVEVKNCLNRFSVREGNRAIREI